MLSPLTSLVRDSTAVLPGDAVLNWSVGRLLKNLLARLADRVGEVETL